jgi:trimeric autotransporter adhesin
MKPSRKYPRLAKRPSRRIPGAARRGFALKRHQLVGAAILVSSGVIALAATVPNTFTSGTPAVAANANFQALVTALTAAEGRIAALETRLASVSIENVHGQPTVRFTGVNVQVVSGSGATYGTPNGTGNLIIGYDEVDTSGISRCSIGMNGATQVNAGNCTANGGTLSTTGFKTGSHYLVLGTQNNYSNFGGIVAGARNFSNWNFASVSDGYGNTASGYSASVNGGQNNTASGPSASVNGGWYNSASGVSSTITGGRNNTSTGAYASVSGGISNGASGDNASVSGGQNNTASGPSASVSGGGNNTANGQNSSVSGGSGNVAANYGASVHGGYNNTASAGSSSVSGGNGCVVSLAYGWDVGNLTAGCSPNVGQ